MVKMTSQLGTNISDASSTWPDDLPAAKMAQSSSVQFSSV